MAHYAVLNSNNVVTSVFVGKDETDTTEPDWEAYYSGPGETAKRTSYNTKLGLYYSDVEVEIPGQPGVFVTQRQALPENQSKAFRKNFAAIGMIYDVERDAFMWPQPFPSWVLDEFSCIWEAPIPKPEGAEHAWSEQQLNWVVKPDDGKPYVWNAELEQWEAVL